MKHSKLIEIRKKARRYSILSAITMGAATIVLFACLGALAGNEVLRQISPAVGLVTIVLSIVFTRLEGKQNRIAEDYFAIRIMDVLNEQGIETGKFELIQENSLCYRVAFHNQIIDYEKMQAVIDEEVASMNKIMKYNMRVTLI